MEKIKEEQEEPANFEQVNPKLGRVAAGIFLVLICSTFLAKSMGVIFPAWFFSWKMIVVAAGLYIGIVNRFRGFFWLLTMLTGFAFMAGDIFPDHKLGNYGWPVILIILGIAFIIRPKRSYSQKYHKYHRHHRNYGAHGARNYTDDFDGTDAPYSHEDYVDAVAVFGQIKKTPISKKFRGGDIVALFGGVKVNLSQADIEDTAEFDLTAVMGGIQLVVPPHWKIKSEAVAIFGGIDDKRPETTAFTSDENKTLILRGAVVFGGIEIKSY